METLNICLVGFGSVNRALVRLVAREAEWLRKHHSLDVKFSAIVARHGAWEPRSDDYLPPVAVLARLADMVAAGEARLDADSLAATASSAGRTRRYAAAFSNWRRKKWAKRAPSPDGRLATSASRPAPTSMSSSVVIA